MALVASHLDRSLPPLPEGVSVTDLVCDPMDGEGSMMLAHGLGGISYGLITSSVNLKVSVSDCFSASRQLTFCSDALSRSCCRAVHAHEAMCAMPPHVAARQPQSQARHCAGLGAFLSRGADDRGGSRRA